MRKIKTKENIKDIKVFDKAAAYSKRMKTALIRSKDQVQNLMDDGQVTPSEYAEDKLKYAAEDITESVGQNVGSGAKRSFEKFKKTYRKHRNEKRIQKNEKRVKEYNEELCRLIQTSTAKQESARKPVQDYAETYRPAIHVKRSQTIKGAKHTDHPIKHSVRLAENRTVKSGAKGTIKSTERTVKTSKASIKTSEVSVKITQKAGKTTAKATQKAAEISRQATNAAYKAVKTSVKAIITGVKALVAAIAAGGWVAVIVIVVICLIALIAGSCFGVFLSGEESGGGVTMQQVVGEINEEYQNRIENIKAENTYDALEISGSRAVWPEVLSVYAVKVTTDPENAMEVVTMTEEKKQLLTEIFWEMNDITYKTEKKTETVITETDDSNGNILEDRQQKTKTYLYITVSHKRVEEITLQYGFNEKQNNQLKELLAQNISMWAKVLYGIYSSDDQMVTVALSQIGNVGGEPYWSWYGFKSRVPWCACFVSWCAEQCGYIDMGIIPKYAGCANGVQWFKDRGQWADNSIEPTPGTIIFFDWEGDGLPDHTGIVEKVENGRIYTVEGNTSDSCKEKSYPVGYDRIFGYGILNV